MKKILITILAIQLIVALTGCCCPCAKKMQEQNNEPAQESAPAPVEEKPAQ